eukprot:TRINITY_DN2215_c0_g1_i3.p1 TRINITY_DN2215_c0_g1~~TRINITY_DN2215_c0_g1_i3.p1  ORF type:complete len:1042 (+),score=206.97 TRINITY_DN2215_c0_g1_i3:68-3193(+)
MSKPSHSESNDQSSENRSNSTVAVSASASDPQDNTHTSKRRRHGTEADDDEDHETRSQEGSSESSRPSRKLASDEERTTTRAAVPMDADAAPNVSILNEIDSRDADPRRDALLDLDILFRALLDVSQEIDSIVGSWLERYHSDALPALAELLNLVLRTCGSEFILQPAQLRSESAEDIANQLLEGGTEEFAAFILASKDKVHKRFISLFPQFWDVLIIQSQSSILHDSQFLPLLLAWIVPFSSCPLRSLRHTATVVGMSVANSLTKTASTLKQTLVAKQQQIEADKRKKTSRRDSALIQEAEDLHQRIVDIENELTTKMFAGLFVHRYRDIVPEIRACCVQSIGDWICNYPFTFLQDNYLKYLGWTLNDKNENVRLACAKSLHGIFVNEEFASQMDSFSKRFLPRLVEMTLDKSIDVAVVCLKILKILSARIDLTGEQMRKIILLLGDSHQELRNEAGAFVFGSVFNDESQQPKTPKKGGKKSFSHEIEIYHRFLNLLKTTGYSEQSVTTYTDALWDQIPAFQNWEALVAMLLRCREESENESADETTSPSGAAKTLGWLRVIKHIMQRAANPDNKLDKKKKSKVRIDRPATARHCAQALLPVIPELICSYQADAEFISPLLDVCHLLDYGVATGESYQQAVPEVLAAVKEAFFATSDVTVLHACAKVIGRIRQTCSTKSREVGEAVDAIVEQVQRRLKPMAQAHTELSERRDKDKIYGTGLSAKRLWVLVQQMPVGLQAEFPPEVRIILTKYISGWAIDPETIGNLFSSYLLHVLWEVHTMCEKPLEAGLLGMNPTRHMEKREWLLESAPALLMRLSDLQSRKVYLEVCDFLAAYGNEKLPQICKAPSVPAEFLLALQAFFLKYVVSLVGKLAAKAPKGKEKEENETKVELQRVIRSLAVLGLVGVCPLQSVSGAVVACMGFGAVQNCKETSRLVKAFYTHATQSDAVTRPGILLDALVMASQLSKDAGNKELAMQCCFELSQWVCTTLELSRAPDVLKNFALSAIDAAFDQNLFELLSLCLTPILSEACTRHQALHLHV